MFNENQKQEYIVYESANGDSLKRYFVRIEPKEKEYNKDIADMNIDELEDTVLYLGIRREDSIGHALSLMRGYINWAILNGKTANDSHINKIKPSKLTSKDAIIGQMLRSPEQVAYILDTVYNPNYYNQPSRATQNRLVFWLLYFGMKIDSLPYLKKTDIDYDNKTVKNPVNLDMFYEINDEVISLWKCQMTQTHIEKVSAHDKSNICYCEIIESDFLFHPIKNNKLNDDRMYNLSSLVYIVISIFDEYSKQTSSRLRVSPSNINLSGIFYKLYLRELNRETITPEVLSDALRLTSTNNNSLRLAMRKYYNDYTDWKEAFNFPSK